MGTWGPGLYQNDVALDIKEEYVDLLRKKGPKDEAYNELINNNNHYLENEDAIPMILALADIQWKYGKLIPEVKKSALLLINTEAALEAWKDNPKDLRKRKEVLNKLKEKLESPQPPEKHLKISKPYKCEWKVGDTYAYKLESDFAKEKKLYGKYLIFIKVDEGEWYPDYVVPIVWVKITKDEHLPQTEERLNELEFIQFGVDRYSRLFKYFHNFDNDYIKRLKKFEFKVNDEYLLPIYRVKLISTSKKVIPKKIIYLGNFENLTSPNNEYVTPIEVEIKPILWKNIEQDMIYFYEYDKRENFDFSLTELMKNEKKFLEEHGYDFNKANR